MAKTYSFFSIAQPTNPSATAVSGGSLTANTTFFYRILKVSPQAVGINLNGKSRISSQFSVTTTSTDRTARITFSCPIQTGCSYRIFRSTSPTEIGTSANLGHINFFPTDALHNVGGVVTFVDDGSGTVMTNNFAEINDQANGVLTLGGSTSGNPFTIVDLFNADVANGWGVIQRLDLNTYTVNCFLIGHTNLHWVDENKTIIFADGFNIGAGSNFRFGRTTGNRTSRGCEIIITGSWLTTFSFPFLFAYRTIFKYIYNITPEPIGLGLVGANFSNGILHDCQIDGFRNFGGTALCTYLNVTMSRFDNAFGAGASSFNNVRMLQGSRVFQTAGSTNITARGLFVEGSWVLLIFGLNNTINLINTIYTQIGAAQSISTGTIINDQSTFNLHITDSVGNNLENVSVVITDRENNVVVNAVTNAQGRIAEQIITKTRFSVTETTISAPNIRSPFRMTLFREGFETYTSIESFGLETFYRITLQPVVRLRKTIDGKLLKALKSETGSRADLLEL